tara:strand:- start:18034 stop:18537 length:504 start_codon:yes stop_codon:yes gene_type:complete
MGGNKGRKQGRKHQTVPSVGLRTREDDDEHYAVFTKLYGGSNAEVMCDDGVARRCIIRNKFRGRHKRDNIVSSGVFCLVGLRSWESRATQQKVDLLHIYTPDHRIRLFKEVAMDWSWATADACADDTSQAFQFSAAAQATLEPQEPHLDVQSTKFVSGEDQIDVDDI